MFSLRQMEQSVIDVQKIEEETKEKIAAVNSQKVTIVAVFIAQMKVRKIELTFFLYILYMCMYIFYYCLWLIVYFGMNNEIRSTYNDSSFFSLCPSSVAESQADYGQGESNFRDSGADSWEDKPGEWV